MNAEVDHQLSGKQWHTQKKAFRPRSGLKSYSERKAQRVEADAVKSREKEMKEEKEAERQVMTTAPLRIGTLSILTRT